MFEKNGNVGNYWERANITISEKLPFQIIIEGVLGGTNSNLGSIGIDDTSFNDGCVQNNNSIVISTVVTTPITTTKSSQCDSNQFQCKSGSCIPLKQVCNFNFDCDDKSDEDECGTCDFENSWCGWYDNSDDETRWTKKKAPSSMRSGPKVDHTTNSTDGNYLITDVSDSAGDFIDFAILLGPKFQETSSKIYLV